MGHSTVSSVCELHSACEEYDCDANPCDESLIKSSLGCDMRVVTWNEACDGAMVERTSTPLDIDICSRNKGHEKAGNEKRQRNH